MATETNDIFVVMADVQYESSTPVKAFRAKRSANAFMKKCETYQEGYTAGCNDQKWKDKHPAGVDNYNADGYSLSVIPFVG
ncbi:hypothetical protein Voja6_00024 [Pseudomonas phage vB_PpuM-Voja-6]